MARYVLSDIHGNKEAWDTILKKIDLQPNDDLYILGDVIDRHPHGIEIMKQIMSMPNAQMLLGNHEYMMLNVVDNTVSKNLNIDALDLWAYNNGTITLKAFLKESKKSQDQIISFLKDLPLEFSDVSTQSGQKVQLVHAAPPEFYEQYKDQADLPERTLKDFAVWDRKAIVNEVLQKTLDHVVIFGHTTTNNFQHTEDGLLRVFQQGSGIGIDCGAGWPEGYGGRLACLCLDNGKVIYSHNEKPRIAMD